MSTITDSQDLSAFGDETIRGGQDALARQEALVALGRRTIAPPELPILLQDAAELLAGMLDMEHSAVATVAADGRSLEVQLRLRGSEPGEVKQLVHKSTRGETDSLADYALRVAHAVEVADLVHDERFDDTFLRGHGIRGAVAVPLQFQDCSFGVLIACGVGRCQLQNEDTLFAETLAYMVTTTVARCRTEDQLAEERRRSAGILQAADAIVLLLDGEGTIEDINPAGERVTGFSLEEIEGRRIWDVLPVPEETGLFRDLVGKLARCKAAVAYESLLLTKHSKRRHIAWSFATTTDTEGELESILATGIDVTERREAEERAERAERAVSETAAGGGNSSTSETQPADHVEATPLGILPGERRSRPRRAYPYRQKIAPCLNESLPNRHEFFTIECHDIGAGGFSFIAPRPPQTESFVVALGTEASPTYLFAKIAHINRIEHDGRQVYLVGCSYTGRVKS